MHEKRHEDKRGKNDRHRQVVELLQPSTICRRTTVVVEDEKRKKKKLLLVGWQAPCPRALGWHRWTGPSVTPSRRATSVRGSARLAFDMSRFTRRRAWPAGGGRPDDAGKL